MNRASIRTLKQSSEVKQVAEWFSKFTRSHGAYYFTWSLDDVNKKVGSCTSAFRGSVPQVLYYYPCEGKELKVNLETVKKYIKIGFDSGFIDNNFDLIEYEKGFKFRCHVAESNMRNGMFYISICYIRAIIDDPLTVKSTVLLSEAGVDYSCAYTYSMVKFMANSGHSFWPLQYSMHKEVVPASDWLKSMIQVLNYIHFPNDSIVSDKILGNSPKWEVVEVHESFNNFNVPIEFVLTDYFPRLLIETNLLFEDCTEQMQNITREAE